MSFVTRRTLSTLVPPKIANPEGLGAAKDAIRMARIAKFYERLPKGPAPEVKPSGLLGRYQARYFGKNASAAPVWHVIFGLVAFGYGMEYYFHLKRNEIVMAEVLARDVVNQTQSGGDHSPSDVPATTYNADSKPAGDDLGVEQEESRENGIHTLSNNKIDDLDDGSARSDTDTSRADGSVSEEKSSDHKTLKKIVAKPVSFAKYSIPKVVAANSVAKPVEKVITPTPNSSSSSLQQVGRPRLVAKTTSSLQQKSKSFKVAAPDPMQVWNKNRVTPQPSTKHLTDEELKQQYGIHLTSRIQTEGEGKEAKWADIDDDEDDWAPETIEWSDGTKTTVNPADIVPPPVPKPDTATPETEPTKPTMPQPTRSLSSQFTSTVGPNAMILKIGASAERQQAQKAAVQLQRSSTEKTPNITGKTTPAPAPTPSKSPWAPLPPVDKISPVVINPQGTGVPGQRHLSISGSVQSPVTAPGMSPAREMSADDFNRSWREPAAGQPRELYMPSSGRYEAVPESRRRMSKNEQNFRAPAVLQRPSQSDIHAPAEPSAAFQTSRTSDSARRRASSIISGGSGQFARRLSMKSGEAPPVFDTPTSQPDVPARPVSSDGPPSQLQTPTYQARGPGADYVSVPGVVPAAQTDIDTQRAQQKALMKENIERARKRKQDEEARLEAEKQERIRIKLASLGPAPAPAESKPEERPSEEEEVAAPEPLPAKAATGSSPPKPPLPLPTGEPQQYGMMKVHPLDSVKKSVSAPPLPIPQTPVLTHPAKETVLESPVPTKTETPSINGDLPIIETARATTSEPPTTSVSSPKISKPKSVPSESRSGWADVKHDHRTPQIANLWGIPNNKALGNGTFDQSLAGYAPQDLSRAPSTAQGWLNDRTPTSGPSPQPQFATFNIGDSRPQSHPTAASPEPQPLAANSEIDSIFPTTRPTPIAPPQAHGAPPSINGYATSPHVNGGITAWNNFHQNASQQERLDSERFQREIAAKREEESRTGVRQGPQYTFQETWKQVHLGDQAGQRHVANVTQSSLPPSNMFGAVGVLTGPDATARSTHPAVVRGSRFFPPNMNGVPVPERRAVTYSLPETSRTPSPPPAEELSSLHPAFDGALYRPVVHFPREKAIVKLPPARSPSPPASVQPAGPPLPEVALTWAARVSMPAPPPPLSVPAARSVSTPNIPNPSWQERFNGLLGKKPSLSRQAVHSIDPALAVASSSRELFDGQPAVSPSVSLPQNIELEDVVEYASATCSKDVEEEDDLFEDREPGSLPTINLQGITLQWPRPMNPHPPPLAIDSTSAHWFMVNNLFEKKVLKPQFAIIKFPGSVQSVKRDIPMKGASPMGPSVPNPRSRHSSGAFNGKHLKYNNGNKAGLKSRQASKVH